MLRKFRLDQGLKQGEMAEILGVPQSSVSAMEHGKTNVAIVYIRKLEAKFGKELVDNYYETTKGVVMKNIRGKNNGYRNVLQEGMDAGTIAKITAIEKDLGSVKESLDTLSGEQKSAKDKADAENRVLREMIADFRVLCALNQLDCTAIMAKMPKD